MGVRTVLLIIALVAWPLHRAAAIDHCAEGALQPVKIANGDRLLLSWIGTVNGSMAGAIDAAFNAHNKRTTSVELSLQSCGGGTDDMAAVIGVLRHIKATHRLTTVVQRGATCASACIPIFLASDRRRAAMSSLWLFHRSWRHRLTGGVDAVRTSEPVVRSTKRLIDRYYAPAGVSRPWLQRLEDIVENKGAYWQTGRDLWAAKSGIITEAIGDIEPQESRPVYLAPAPGCAAMCRG
jgi:ATP-dependent protease ClpP protease subunit